MSDIGRQFLGVPPVPTWWRVPHNHCNYMHWDNFQQFIRVPDSSTFTRCSDVATYRPVYFDAHCRCFLHFWKVSEKESKSSSSNNSNNSNSSSGVKSSRLQVSSFGFWGYFPRDPTECHPTDCTCYYCRQSQISLDSLWGSQSVRSLRIRIFIGIFRTVPNPRA